MKSETLSLKNIINELNFLGKEVIIQWNFWKKKKYLLFLTNKLIEKISDLRDAKEHYESFIRNKN